MARDASKAWPHLTSREQHEKDDASNLRRPLSIVTIAADEEAGERQLSTARQDLAERRVQDALAGFNLAESMGASADACAAGRWECHMLAGDFASAWQESRSIEQRGGGDTRSLWDGQSFHGKRVIVRCLHGYGDAIQFIRYAPLLRREASRVIVETHPEMVALLRKARGVDEVITWGPNAPNSAPEWDVQIEVMELPRAFRTTVETIPASIPYILLSESERADAQKAFPVHPSREARLKVGLIWKSSGWNPKRSMQLQDILPLCANEKCSFYSLQWDTAPEELELISKHRLLHPIGGWDNIEQFACLLTAVDLVITADTMAAHLSGALGVPVWMLLPFQADWRWMLDREDSPWYPTMRLFRQSEAARWADVVERVKSSLQTRIAGKI